VKSLDKVDQPINWRKEIDPGPVLAIGILAYGGVHDLIRCMLHIQRSTFVPFECCIFDNTEDNRTNVKAVQEFGDQRFTVIDSPYNVGCSVSRNRVFDHFREKYSDLKYFAFLDQDVLVHDGWASDMIHVMEHYPKAGIVAWPQANIGNVPTMPDGLVSMVSSCCNMHRAAALIDVIDMFGFAWDERFFFYRFDSLFAQRNNQAGWRTYLCLRYFLPKVPWLKQVGGISHPAPNSGIKRNPKWREIRATSDRLYRQIKKDEGWEEYDPFNEIEVSEEW